MHKDHYDDAHMLCKVLDSTAAQALELKRKISEGHQLPSWAEYKVYKAGDAIKSALGCTYSMSDHISKDMPMSMAIQKVAGIKRLQRLMKANAKANKALKANPSMTAGSAEAQATHGREFLQAAKKDRAKAVSDYKMAYPGVSRASLTPANMDRVTRNATAVDRALRLKQSGALQTALDKQVGRVNRLRQRVPSAPFDTSPATMRRVVHGR